MREDQYIKSVKFIPFLRRELSLLATSIVITGYTSGLKSSIDFKFKNICYLGNGIITDSLRVETELNKYNEVVRDIILHNQAKCHKFLDKGLKINDEVEKFFKQKKGYKNFNNTELYKELKSKLTTYENLFLFSTVLPYETGKALEYLVKHNKIKNYSRLKNKINKLRKVSLYTVYEDKALKNIFQEIANRKDINDYKLLSNLTHSELLSCVKENINFTDKALIYRKKYINLLTPKMKFIKFGEKNYNKYYKILIPKRKTENASIQGQVAYPGKVKGKAKIILSAKDIASFKKGEILVTISSNPVLLPAIKKSLAIISDEGGMTCHASIISREFKIPCIVGTKNATRVIKTGDFLEVDAVKGVVKKIKSL